MLEELECQYLITAISAVNRPVHSCSARGSRLAMSAAIQSKDAIVRVLTGHEERKIIHQLAFASPNRSKSRRSFLLFVQESLRSLGQDGNLEMKAAP